MGIVLMRDGFVEEIVGVLLEFVEDFSWYMDCGKTKPECGLYHSAYNYDTSLESASSFGPLVQF